MRFDNKREKPKFHISYKGQTINTSFWKEMSDEEFQSLKEEYYRKPSLDDVRYEVRNIFLKGTNQMTKINDYFIKDLITKTKLHHSKFTIADLFEYKPLLEIFNAKIETNLKVFPPRFPKLRRLTICFNLGGSGIATKASNFRLDKTKEIIMKYNLNNYYYDPSCGWGVRLTGALACGVNYYGTDPNYELVERLNQIAGLFKEIDLFAPTSKIYCQGSEIFIPELEGKIGMAFTSPPYFFLEDYGVGEQSTKNYPEYKDWKKHFLLATFKNVYRYLIPGGHMLINIKNYAKFDLEGDTVNCALEAGFEFAGKELFENITRLSSLGEPVDNNENIFVFRKGDNIYNIDYNKKITLNDDEEDLDETIEITENDLIDLDDIEEIEEKGEINMHETTLFEKQDFEPNKKLFSVEQVSKYHPDKYADQISDAIVFMALRNNLKAKCAIETLVKDNTVIVAGEINDTTLTNPEIEKVILNVAEHLGYKVDKIINLISKQSIEIAKAVSKEDGTIGAGDQGMMFGYATRETETYLPFAFDLANKIIKYIEDDVPNGVLNGDAKCQVTVDLNKPKTLESVEKVLVSVCHKSPTLNVEEYIKKLLKPLLKDKTDTLLVNPAGIWLIGGPTSDAGVTGRKIVCDQYGAFMPVGGGAFSGKDLTKVDRSGAYSARNIAIDILENYPKLQWIKIQLAYAIGVEQPVSIFVDSNDKSLHDEIEEYIYKNYDLSPQGMIEELNLKPKDFVLLAQGCHFRYGKVSRGIK